VISDAELKRRYDYYLDTGKLIEGTAPYGLVKEDGKVIDAGCVRKAGAYANDPKGSKHKANARLDDGGNLVAEADIYQGDEIFASYGKEYWKYQKALQTQMKYRRPNKSVGTAGAKGRVKLAPVAVPAPVRRRGARKKRRRFGSADNSGEQPLPYSHSQRMHNRYAINLQ
jgi:hypothetical protein